MSTPSRQRRVLSLFEHLASLTGRATLDKVDPRLEKVGRLPKRVLFSPFNPKHMIEAKELYRILFAARDFDDFMHLAKQARQIVNQGLFAFSVSVALLHRPDTRSLSLPPVQEVFPDKFVPAETINEAIREDENRKDDNPIIVDIYPTGSELDPEYKLAYFREDVAANSHHWYWHVIYPHTWDWENGKEKDRKGELFFYMHQQMLARYDTDRLAVGLARTVTYDDYEEKLEGYDPHLTILATGLPYAPRPDGLVLHDVRGLPTIKDLERWTDRIMEAIDVGAIVGTDNKEISLQSESGIDLLGALVESSVESKNRQFYGNLHNYLHDIIARITDPDDKFKISPGVLSDTTTAMRDPVFYRMHRFIDDIFNAHKETLPIYEKKDLDFPGVSVVNATIKAKVPNVVNTSMKEGLLELSHGLSLKGSVKVKYQHLDHEPFSYTINCENSSGAAQQATVRIFLAPVYDEQGVEFTLSEARRYFIELDKFRADLAPGKNTITRLSRESSVTLPPPEQFVDLLKKNDDDATVNDFCNCGWPDYLLIPRGNHRGMDFHLFVIFTDYEQDKVEGENANLRCNDAVSYCGSKDQKYPDKKPMGFPFDRVIIAEKASDFCTPNMIFQRVKIQFKELV